MSRIPVNDRSFFDRRSGGKTTNYCFSVVTAVGLQLFISSDGTTTLGGQDVKRQLSSGAFKKVVVEEHR